MADNKIDRIGWVDYSKGFPIILVVMLHTTLGVHLSLGAFDCLTAYFVKFAQTFRMPLFFMVSGLFLHRTINNSWQEYIDKKLLHFIYFYILWSIIQIGAKILAGSTVNKPINRSNCY